MGLGKVLEAGFQLGLPVAQWRCMSAIGTDSVCVFLSLLLHTFQSMLKYTSL